MINFSFPLPLEVMKQHFVPFLARSALAWLNREVRIFCVCLGTHKWLGREPADHLTDTNLKQVDVPSGKGYLRPQGLDVPKSSTEIARSDAPALKA